MSQPMGAHNVMTAMNGRTAGLELTAQRRGLSRGLLAALTSLPLVGAVGGSPFARSPVVEDRDPEIGQSVSPLPTIVRISVDDKEGAPADVGSLVKKKFFAESPGFIFNVCFSRGPGNSYCDPQSIWFNVFSGYYEIDVSCKAWGRPFGYLLGEGCAPTVHFDDVIRIGKADWNYFSNYMYGVPARNIESIDRVGLGRERYAYLGREWIEGGEGRGAGRGRYWDQVELDHVEVISAYLSGRDDQVLESPSPVLSPLWRLSFGRPHPRPAYTQSFIPTEMRARLYMSYSQDYHPALGETYRTLIFGGTANNAYPDKAKNERFLDLQMRAVRHVIGKHYSDLGFEQS